MRALFYRYSLSNSIEVYLPPLVSMLALRSITKKKVTDANDVYGQVTYPFSDPRA